MIWAGFLRPLRDFGSWWLGELIELIPQGLRSLVRVVPIKVRIRSDGRCEIAIPRAPPSERQGQTSVTIADDWPTACAWLGQQYRWLGRLVGLELVLPPERCLTLQKSIPVAAAHSAQQLFELELGRAAPFAREEIYFDQAAVETGKPTNGQLEIQLVVVKRRYVDGYLGDLAALGIPVSALRVADGHGRSGATDLLRMSQAARMSPQAVLDRAIVGALLVAVLAGLGLEAARVVGRLHALEAIGVEVAALKSQANSVRKSRAAAEDTLGRVAAPRLRKQEGPPVLQMWNEITRLLPDSAWLAEFRVEGARALLDGHARSASELIPALATSRYIVDAEFASPVIRDPQTGLERFQIRLKLSSGVAGPDASSTAPRVPL